MPLSRTVSSLKTSSSSSSLHAHHHHRNNNNNNNNSSIQVQKITVRTTATTNSNDSNKTEDKIPSNCARITIEAKKPLGLVLEEDGLGGIKIRSINAEGNVAKLYGNKIGSGDKVLAISAQVKTRTQVYNEVSVGSGEEIIRLTVQGESFDTVMAAISSYPSQKTMKIDILKCQ
jgi:hypothetical protein